MTERHRGRRIDAAARVSAGTGGGGGLRGGHVAVDGGGDHVEVCAAPGGVLPPGEVQIHNAHASPATFPHGKVEISVRIEN